MSTTVEAPKPRVIPEKQIVKPLPLTEYNISDEVLAKEAWIAEKGWKRIPCGGMESMWTDPTTIPTGEKLYREVRLKADDGKSEKIVKQTVVARTPVDYSLTRAISIQRERDAIKK